METQAAPTEEPTNELAPAEVSMEEATPTEEPIEELDPAEVSMEDAAPTEEPTEELAPAEASMEEVAPMEEPNKELATPMAMVSGSAEEPDIPPVWHKEKEKGEMPCSNFPAWTEVLHLTWSVIPTGQTPLTLGGLRQRCCSWRGEVEPSNEELRNAGKLHRKRQTLHHHQNPLNPCQRLHCPQASRGLWPAC